MACEYFVNGEWISENQFKEILIGDEDGGLLDALINDGKFEVKGFPTIDNRNIEETIVRTGIPVKNLQKILIDEVKSRKGYNLDIISALELNDAGTDFKIPLWSSPYASKFESLLTAVITNGVIKQKFNGHSYVLASEEGFKTKKLEGDASNAYIAKNKSSIVFTDSFDPEKGLLPMRLGPSGELLPAQIMIPFNFKNKDEFGNKLKIEDFITTSSHGRKFIDTTKIDPKILKIFGFRIPTQGHNSMGMLEIVGFLPEISGDMMLAPRDFTVQMGSDFDVDKMYSYMYNVQLKNGKLTTEFDESQGLVENRQNKILDIHFAVMSNPDEEMIRYILAPDSPGEYESLAAEVYKNRKASGAVTSTTTILSDVYQRTKYTNAIAGKSGTGNFSLDSTFAAIAQGKNLIYFENDEMTYFDRIKMSNEELLKYNESRFTFGTVESNGDLSSKYTLKSQQLIDEKGGIDKLTSEEKKSLKLKSKVIQGLQSASVDNEKAQILDKLNINDETFDAIRAMEMLGFEEDDIVGLITQDVIWQYVEYVKAAKTTLRDVREYNAPDNFRKMIQEKYYPVPKPVGAKMIYNSDSGRQLLELTKSPQLVDLVENSSVPFSNARQYNLLEKFLELSKVGKSIKTVQSSINTESSGLPKNLLETTAKVTQINKLNKSRIINASALLGEYADGKLIKPTTINGFASYHGAIMADNIYRQFFPYNTSGFNTQYNEIASHSKVDDSEMSFSQESKLKLALFKEIRSFLFTKNDLGLYDGDILKEQRRLFINDVKEGPSKNQSLAAIIKVLGTKNWFMKNNFLNKLIPNVNNDGNQSTVTFEASVGENYDERAIYLGFLELLSKDPYIGTFNGIEYTTRSLAQDLIAYAFLEGGNQGAKQFIKYIPIEYLKGTNFGGVLANVNFDYVDTFGGQTAGTTALYTHPSRFTVQYFQNNPKEAKTITLDMIDSTQGLGTLMEFNLKPDFIEANEVVYEDEFSHTHKTQTQFITVFDGNYKNKYALFQYDEVDKIYKRIQIVSGKYGFKQYSGDGKMDVPVVLAQVIKPATINQTIPGNTAELTSDKKPIKIKNPLKVLGNLVLDETLSDGDSINDIFNKLILDKGTTKYYRTLINRYRELGLPKGFTLNLRAGFNGYNSETRIMSINGDDLKGKPVNVVANAILHELNHVYTAPIIKNFAQGKEVTGAQKASLTRLSALQNKYIKHLNKNPNSNAKLAEIRARYELYRKNRSVNPNFTASEISEYYGALKLEEFVTMVYTDRDFQEILNNVIDGDKSLLEKILQELFNLIKSLGFNVNTNSVFAEAFYEVTNLLDNVNINTDLEYTSVTSVSEDTTEKTVVTPQPSPLEQVVETPKPKNPFDGSALIGTDLLPSSEQLSELRRMC